MHLKRRRWRVWCHCVHYIGWLRFTRVFSQESTRQTRYADSSENTQKEFCERKEQSDFGHTRCVSEPRTSVLGTCGTRLACEQVFLRGRACLEGKHYKMWTWHQCVCLNATLADQVSVSTNLISEIAFQSSNERLSNTQPVSHSLYLIITVNHCK